MKLFYDNQLIKMKQETQLWQQHKPVIPAFRRPKQENQGLQASQGYIMTISKRKKKKKKIRLERWLSSEED